MFQDQIVIEIEFLTIAKIENELFEIAKVETFYWN